MSMVSQSVDVPDTAPPRDSAADEHGPERTGVTIRPIFLVLWAIVSVALLAEYTFTIEDLREARHSRHHLALSLSDVNPEEELAEGPMGRVNELETRVNEAQARLLDVQRQRNALQEELYRLRTAVGTEVTGSDADPDLHAPNAPGATDHEAPTRHVPEREPHTVHGRGLRPPTVVGHIVAHARGSDIVAIDVGRRSGLRRDSELVVRSDDREIGRVVVLDCRDTMAAGRIVLYGGQSIPSDARVEYTHGRSASASGGQK